jgi:acetamidase/formamidase
MSEHRFFAREYYLTYGFHSPVLTIRPGDTVFTRLLDAHGYDEKDEQVAGSPNPLTGPIYIEGARPGNTLAVTIERLTPNRTRGWASQSFHPNLANYGDAAYKKDYIDWDLDLERQRALPRVTDQIEIPFAPVLGCIGVAPGYVETARSTDCGIYGGNMDLGAITTGTTVYLPVFVEGAYLFLGDGHAAQGAGEVTGNGIEVSFDLQFSIEVVATSAYAHLRASDSERIYSIANAKPLEEACRQATQGMAAWLMETYGFQAQNVGLLMGQVVDYKIGNLVSHAFSVACTIERRFLAIRAVDRTRYKSVK